MPPIIIPERIKKIMERETKSKKSRQDERRRKRNQDGKTEEEIEDEEIFDPLNRPEFEHPLKWLKSILDLEISDREYDPWHDQEGKHDILLRPNCEHSKFAYETPAFLKFLKWLHFEEPNERHKDWFIPKDFSRSELVIRSKQIKSMIHTVEIMEAKGIDFAKCKGCNYEFNNLQLHLNKNVICRSRYSATDMEELKELLKSMTSGRKMQWYRENKERMSLHMRKYHQENRERILLKMKANAKDRRNRQKDKSYM